MTHTHPLATDLHKNLQHALGDAVIEIVDHTHKHRHHASHPAGMFHIELKIKAPHLDKLSRVSKDRLVYGALAPMLETQIHSLQITWITNQRPDSSAG